MSRPPISVVSPASRGVKRKVKPQKKRAPAPGGRHYAKHSLSAGDKKAYDPEHETKGKPKSEVPT